MAATAIIALTSKDFEGLEIGTDTVGWVHGEVVSPSGWLVHGDPRHLRILASALVEAAGKAEAHTTRAIPA